MEIAISALPLRVAKTKTNSKPQVMKPIFTAIVITTLLGSTVFMLPKLIDQRTPEQREADEVEKESLARRDRQEQLVAAEASAKRAAEVASARLSYEEELLKLPSLDSVQFTDGEVFIVRFAPLVHIGEDHVRVLCEKLAAGWAARAGLRYARCESWYGNKKYATGIYQGDVPVEYHERMRRAALSRTPEIKALHESINATEERVRQLLRVSSK